ncbi:hypothetical protein ASPSYDRAFT_152516 [Aspergillus sydowii CBS 593.65]|uniref:FUN14 domain-containing protein n=1 Tax=Aspergillus sydowii CBS 593.65 TaxID=1036612 RepID=A0A1L9TG12_9EURO|nr:uncharacterized protein ASPSYDRAFT_152516 [Aspergillus sydowii CBS 593.65]OJJ58233.1 hypothetical protein ASPSYDRAFT_152516 [Aspergillus sydowii CBS 593.65]
MASGLLTLSRTSAVVGIGLGLSFSMLPSSPFRALPMKCDYTAPYSRPDSTDPAWAVHPQDPLVKKQGTTVRQTGILTASNMRQVSMGSVLGLVVGVGLRAFSRVLVVLFGMGIVAIEWAASKGYNILPVHRLQKYVKSVNLEKMVSRHVPFKLSFGATMALAAFAQF